ncbi:TetR family transcriptional regulator C-terminal domain-containing protein, partial [Streptomyces sp. NPDC001948]
QRRAVSGRWPGGERTGRDRDLVDLLERGASAGEFRPVDAGRYATRLRALLDGFSVHVAVGLPGTGRPQVLAQVREFIEESLTVR